MRFVHFEHGQCARVVAFVVAGLYFIAESPAAVVLTRPALQALLGGPGTLEDFESFNISSGNAAVLDVSVLHSASIANGQGPGLVVPGVTYTSSVLQWNGDTYYGSPSREILGNAQPFTIDFSASVDAYGVDLRAYTGFPAVAQMDVYATNDTTLIGTLAGIALGGVGSPFFVGWEDAAGIGKFVLTQTGQSWAPIIDNLEFGRRTTTGIPELSSVLVWSMMTLSGLALAWRRPTAIA
jgi:hypothetical protein